MMDLETSALVPLQEAARSHGKVILRLNLIGPMEAWGPDRTSVLPLGRKTRALLAILALVSPRSISRPKLAELLWSRRHEEQARASLRQEIHRLSESLQLAGGEILNVTRDHVALRPEQVWVDVEEVLRATPANPSGLELLKGRLLDEFDGVDPAFDVWLAGERERLTERIRAVAETMLRHPGEPETTILVAQRLLSLDRANESAWQSLMAAYAARGDRGMAVQAYERCRAVLKEKLDATPSPDTLRLLAGIRSGSAQPPEPPPPEPPAALPGTRIGVLPLQMLGTEPADAHLSLTVADAITASLSAFRSIYPVSSSALQQQGSREGAALAQAFNLRFLVDGSVQRAGNRLRVAVRLLDLEDGSRVVSAHQLDRDADDLLQMQDDAAARVAGQFLPEIMQHECRRAAARPLAGASAYDLVMRAIPLMTRLRRDEFDEAGALLRRALAQQPDFAPAHAWRAYWLTLLAVQGWAPDIEAVQREGIEHAERAVALDAGDAGCLAIAGHVRARLDCCPGAALDLHAQSLAVNPNLAMAIGLAAVTHVLLGEVDAASALLARHAHVAPLAPASFYVDPALTMIAILRRDYPAAVSSGRRAVQLHPNYNPGLTHYLSALGHAGPAADAPAVLRRLLAAQPGFTVQHAMRNWPMQCPADVAHYHEGLRLAGVPEGEGAGQAAHLAS